MQKTGDHTPVFPCVFAVGPLAARGAVFQFTYTDTPGTPQKALSGALSGSEYAHGHNSTAAGSADPPFSQIFPPIIVFSRFLSIFLYFLWELDFHSAWILKIIFESRESCESPESRKSPESCESREKRNSTPACRQSATPKDSVENLVIPRTAKCCQSSGNSAYLASIIAESIVSCC